MAKNDPALFLQLHKPPVLIDEVQYAPELFTYIKIHIDEHHNPGDFWLTGSQAFRMMELAQESLAGRTAVLRLSSLSQHELYGQGENRRFVVDLASLKERKKTGSPANLSEIYRRIWEGSMPGRLSGRYRDRTVFYSSYLQTYIERDVGELIPNVDKLRSRTLSEPPRADAPRRSTFTISPQTSAFPTVRRNGGFRFWRNRRSFSI